MDLTVCQVITAFSENINMDMGLTTLSILFTTDNVVRVHS